MHAGYGKSTESPWLSQPIKADGNEIKALLENKVLQWYPAYSKYQNQVLKIICASLGISVTLICQSSKKELFNCTLFGTWYFKTMWNAKDFEVSEMNHC